MSPFTAIALLCLFKQGRMSLTESQYDECFDAITGLLEEVNDHRHRCTIDHVPTEK